MTSLLSEFLSINGTVGADGEKIESVGGPGDRADFGENGSAERFPASPGAAVPPLVQDRIVSAGRNCRAVITSKPCATGSMGCGVIVARDLYGDGTDQKASQYLGTAIDQPCGCRVALPRLIGAFTSVTTRQPGAF